MKPGPLSKRAWPALLLAGAIAAVAFVSLSFKQAPGPSGRQYIPHDTVPDKITRHLDEALGELNDLDLQKELQKAMQEVHQAMKNFDAEKINEEMKNALKEVDMARIRQEVQAALADVDLKKAQEQVQESLKALDREKLDQQIRAALKEADLARIQEDVKKAVAKIDWENIRQELEKAGNVNMDPFREQMEKVKTEMNKIEPRLKEEMNKVRVQLEKEKAEREAYRGFTNQLDKDGLINQNGSYSVRHRDGKLFINGEKVKKKIYRRYHDFLEKHPAFTLEKNGDDLNMQLQ